MNALLRTEGLRTALMLAAGLLAGLLLGSAAWGLVAGLTALLAWHLYYALRLLQWSQSPKKVDLPEGSGIWNEIYTSSYLRYKQARQRKKRLSGMLSEFRASTAALPDAAVVLDSAGRISWSNDAAQTLLGLKGGRDLGQRINNLLRNPQFLRYLEQEEELDDGVELSSPIQEGATLWVRVIPYGKQQKLLIARDVSAFKRLEQTRRDFVANASHELRTPLTVVRGYLDMMCEEMPEQQGLSLWEGPVQEMRKQAARMQQIITDLLKLANLEVAGSRARPDVVAMPALLAGLMEEAEQISAGKHTLSAQIDPELYLTGAESELHSVAANLLTNAIRYTPEGGAITLSWTRERDGHALLAISDTGIGIPTRDIPRLTERFYRADVARSRETGGTGLGLAIVKHALERHEAELEIRSQLGRGSTFSCHFPASRARQAEHLPAAS